MKKIRGNNLILLAIGAFILSATFILSHYFAVSDFSDGALKGVGLGFMILSLILTSHHQPCKTNQG